MLAVTFYAIPSLILNGGVGITLIYIFFAALNTLMRITETIDDVSIDLFILFQTIAFSGIGGVIFLLTKLRLNRDGKNLVQEAQVAAIKAASLDATDKIAENGFSKESEGNPVQQILRRNSSVSMKHCPYTIDENVIFDCPCCFAKVAVSAWHFGDKLSRTGGGCFFTLRKRMGTLLDISEDIQQYQDEMDVKRSTEIKNRILRELSSLQFKKSNFDESDTSSLKTYIYWQMQRSLMCKANYLFRAVSECCKPCRSHTLATEVVNRSYLSYSCMGLLISFFLLRASTEVRDLTPLLYLNGILSPCLSINAMLSSMVALCEIYGVGREFPSLFKDDVISKWCEKCKVVLILCGMKKYFTNTE